MSERITNQEYFSEPRDMSPLGETESTPMEKSSAEARRALFTEKKLSSLPIEKYLELWGIGSPYFVSHITRQGFRDHTTNTHPGGVGEFYSGFKNILESGVIGSPYYAMGLKELSKEGVRNFLRENGVLVEANKEEALQRYRELVSKEINGYTKLPIFADRASVHVAVEDVADNIYGGETGNEVFVIYPADLVASQFAFSFNTGEQDKGFVKSAGSHVHNDVFLWKQGGLTTLAVNAGIVFLPKSTPVDPETGSQYKAVLNEKGETKRQVDGERVSQFIKWLNKNNTISFEDEQRLAEDMASVFCISGELSKKIAEKLFRNNDSNPFSSKTDKEGKEVWVKKSDQEIQDIINLEEDSSYQNAFWLNLLYKRPENTIEAQQYWQSIFLKGPLKEPKHIVFYDGDPTNAVKQYLKDNNIIPNKETNKLLGFDENEIVDRKKDLRASEGFDQIDQMTKEILDEIYP